MPQKRGPSIIVADDHPLLRSALRLYLVQLFPQAEIIEAESFDTLKQAAARNPRAELVLLDLLMPDAEGFSSLLYLRKQHPRLRVAVVSAVEQTLTMRSAMALGAVGYLTKSLKPEQMQEGLRTIVDGGTWQAPARAGDADPQSLERKLDRLSRQEMRVLLTLADGQLNKQIAGDLAISESTVKAHMRSILQKLDLARRTQAAVLAQKLLRTDADVGHELHRPTEVADGG